MVVKKFGYRVGAAASPQPIGYVIRFGLCRKLSVAVVFTVTAIWPFDANCLGVIWSSLTGN